MRFICPALIGRVEKGDKPPIKRKKEKLEREAGMKRKGGKKRGEENDIESLERVFYSLGEKEKRGFIAVSKIVQCVSNGVTNFSKKEAHLHCLSPFLQSIWYLFFLLLLGEKEKRERKRRERERGREKRKRTKEHEKLFIILLTQTKKNNSPKAIHFFHQLVDIPQEPFPSSFLSLSFSSPPSSPLSSPLKSSPPPLPSTPSPSLPPSSLSSSSLPESPPSSPSLSPSPLSSPPLSSSPLSSPPLSPSSLSPLSPQEKLSQYLKNCSPSSLNLIQYHLSLLLSYILSNFEKFSVHFFERLEREKELESVRRKGEILFRIADLPVVAEKAIKVF